MAKTLDHLEPRAALADIARQFYARGWMPGTAGNLSTTATLSPAQGTESIWITGSGLPKGHLTPDDFLHIAVADGRTLDSPVMPLKPSAETCIHQAIYRIFPTVRACFHIHTVDACVATHFAPANAASLALPPLEILKGLGIWDDNPRVQLPLFENHVHVSHIARDIEQRQAELAPLPALMIRNHGVTVWGTSLQETFNRVECIEFIFSCLAHRQ